MDIDTLVLHALDRRVEAYGAIVEPIVMSTTFERSQGGCYEHGYSYSRIGNPNRSALEAVLAKLEGGEVAFAFTSGSAAVMALFQALNPGDHIIAPRDCYHGTQSILEEIFLRWGLSSSFVDMTNLAEVNGAIKSSTRMIWIETPSNPRLRIYDMPKLIGLAKDISAISVVDNTIATPVLQRPFLYGCDYVLHSTTKAIAGHSDVLGGAVVARAQNDWTKRIRQIQTKGGAVLSPFDSWLTLRGIRTLPLRVRAASKTALDVAQFLEKHSAVQMCHYPGLVSHPQHSLASKIMSEGYGSLLSFEVVGGQEKAFQVTERLKLFTRATSLGGVESLVEHRASIEPSHREISAKLLRISIGLESSRDLISDLDHALRA